MRYRCFHSADTPALVEIVARAMPADAVSAEWFAEYVLLDVNFDPDGLIVAETDSGVPVGFVYAVRTRPGSTLPADPVGGWLTLGAVDPDAQRQGVGTELLRRAVRFLRDGGSQWAVVAGYPPAYFVPGVDAATYPGALALLERAGFDVMSRPVAMGRDLSAYRPPADHAERVSDLRALGYTVAPARAGDLPEVIAFATREFAADWGEAVRAAAVRFGRPERVLTARDPGGAVVGFATYAAYRGLVERFGPFGVAGTERGQGLGGVLLSAALSRMRAEGANSAWFLWTGEQSPAGRLYARSGFAVTRRFSVLQLSLAVP